MKKKNILMVLAMLIVSVAYSQSVYYYTNGEKRYLRLEDNRRFVLVKTSDTTAFKRNCSILESTAMFFKPLILSDTSFMTEDFSWSIVDVDGKDVFVNVDLEYDAPFFIAENNEVVGLSHLFYVQLHDLEDTSLLRAIANNYKVEILGHNVYMPLWFTLACSNESLGNALEMANIFYESGFFEAAEPDIMVEGLLQCVNDPLFSQQWGLQNIGQDGGTEGVDIHYCSAQELTKGESYIKVAIIDEGVDLQHEDLPNITSSYDLFDHQSQDEIYGPHGTACAGIIGASADNNVGVAGISPNCQLMSIVTDFHINADVAQRMANGIEWAWRHGASVISNSWTIKNIPVGLINTAIQDAVSQGRNGKGCVIVFSSGNENHSYVEYPSSNENVISVGAIDRCGNRCVRVDVGYSCDYWDSYHLGSSYGQNLSVVAPGVSVPTTDRSGFLGYTTNDYRLDFLGTSSACPHVSGIAALMLSVDSNLLWTDVRDIIELTAQKVGNYEYEEDGVHTNGKWNEQ